jgi:hypothetical protein
MSNEDRPITSRRERRLAQQAALASAPQEQLTPEQAEAEARGQAEAAAAAARARSEALAAAHGAAAAAARGGDAPSSATGRPAPRTRAAEPGSPERSSQARARDRAAQRVLRELAEKEQAAQSSRESFPTRRSIRERETGKIPPITGVPEAPGQPQGEASGAPAPSAQSLPVVPPPHSPGAPGTAPIPGVDPAPPTAMQGIVPQGLTVTPALGPETGSFRRLSHEQIAAARELLKEQAKNQAAMLEAQRGRAGTEVDPALLAEQVAMAERAAVLNRRAQAKQRLAEESRKEAAAPARKAPAPAATDNLAMVTPLEFVRVPGVPHPVMKPPTTTHVPVVTGKNARQARAAGAPTGSRPVDLRRAQPRGEMSEGAPVSARSAHGLDPLDSAHAGVGRAQRERLVLLAIGAIGILALIVAIIMIVLGGK